MLAYHINRKKENKDSVKKYDMKNIETLKNYLMFSNITDILKTFHKTLDIKLEIDYNSNLLKESDDVIHILLFDKMEININDIIEIYHKYSSIYKEINVYCFDYNTDIDLCINQYILSLTINIMTINDIYLTYFKDNNLLQINKLIPLKPKQKYSLLQIFEKILAPSNWRKYTLYGILILAMNTFNKDKLYYNIFASIFILLSIICIFRKLFCHAKDSL
ncbi:MAG: hypothetical protein E7361_02560 [Clostridiales bacterium]|nr:hypothetical protein [Clostridiales bacterium]